VCPEGLENCDGHCSDLQSDARHCGACEAACTIDKVCDTAVCVCPPNLDDCNGTCVDLESDKNNCGMCGEACPSNQICDGGYCGCEPEQTLCGPDCVDIDSDPDHCGGCDDACPTGDFCTERECLTSPCDGICNSPTRVTPGADGFRVEPLGLSAGCYEVRDYMPTATDPRIVCWEFLAGRTLRVNGDPTPCLSGMGAPLPAIRADGYCVQVSAGGASFAGFLFPTR
jgi:hypothetical protein